MNFLNKIKNSYKKFDIISSELDKLENEAKLLKKNLLNMENQLRFIHILIKQNYSLKEKLFALEIENNSLIERLNLLQK